MKRFCIITMLIQINALSVFAQCCSPGSPVGGTSALGVLDKGTFQVFLNYKYGYSDTYYRGDRPTEEDFIDNGNYNYLGSVVAYGLLKRLTLELDIGYMFNKTQNYVPGITPKTLIGRGLTDVNFSTRFNLYRNLVSDWEVSSGLGIKIPLGKFEQTYQDAILPPDLQPTTGSFDFFHTLFLYKGFVKKHVRLFLINRIELKRQNRAFYKYGNLYTTSFFTSYSVGVHWVFLMQLRTEIRARDTRPETGTGLPAQIDDREKIIPTGSQKLFVVPQVTYILKSWTFSTLVDIPAYQYYNDKQLASTVAVSVSVSKKFDLKRRKKKVIKDE